MSVRKITALFLAAAMCLCMAPGTAFADEPDKDIYLDEYEEMPGGETAVDESGEVPAVEIVVDENGNETIPVEEWTEEDVMNFIAPEDMVPGELLPDDMYIPKEESSDAVPGLEGEELPQILLEEEADTAYQLWVLGEQVTSANANDVLGDGGSVKYKDSTKTLTFNDPEVNADSGYYQNSLIYTTMSELTLKGKADFDIKSRTGPYYCFRGGSCDLTVNGDFSFWNTDIYSYNAYEYAIYADDISIKGGNVTAYGTYYGIYSLGDIDITGGNVNVTGLFQEGIHAEYNVSVSNAEVKSAGGYYGIRAVADDVILNGNIKANDRFDRSENGYGICADNGGIIINGGTVMSSGYYKAMWAHAYYGEYGGITFPASHSIRYPEGGIVREDGREIVCSDGATATQYAYIASGTLKKHKVRFLEQEESDKVLFTYSVEEGMPLPDPGTDIIHPDHPLWHFDGWERLIQFYAYGRRSYQYIDMAAPPGRARPLVLGDMDVFATFYAPYRMAVYDITGNAESQGGQLMSPWSSYGTTSISGSMTIGKVPSSDSDYFGPGAYAAAPNEGYYFVGWMEVPSGETPNPDTGTILSDEPAFSSLSYVPEGDGSTVYALFAAGNDISKCTVTGIKDKMFTGKAITQSITVKDGDKVLKNGTDYKVTYKSNKNPGKGIVKIKGIGNYGGLKQESFRIWYTDVPKSHNFQEHVYWATDAGIAAGYTGSKLGLFGVSDEITRGQVVMFIWRAAGKPLPNARKQTFKDVPTDHSFFNAIQWAAEQGITGGYTGAKKGYFGPSDGCTRGQICTFLWRFAAKPAPADSTAQSFNDVPLSHNFYEPIQWASEQKITAGYKDGTFGVNKICTRGHCVTFLHREMVPGS